MADSEGPSEKKPLKHKLKQKGQDLRNDNRESSATKTCKKKRRLWENLVEKKISVNPSRLKLLQELESTAQPMQLSRLIGINLSQSVKNYLSANGISMEASIDVPANPDKWYDFKHHMKIHFQTSQAVLYEVQPIIGAEPLSLLDRSVAAMSTILQLPLVVLVRPAKFAAEVKDDSLADPLAAPGGEGSSRYEQDELLPAVHPRSPKKWYQKVPLKGSQRSSADDKVPSQGSQKLSGDEKVAAQGSQKLSGDEKVARKFAGMSTADAIRAYTNGTWPVFEDEAMFLQFITTPSDLPKLVAVRDAIAADVAAKVLHLKDVNKFKFGLKRAAVALIPFAVMTVNLMGIVRLVKRMLTVTGMLNDKEAKKASVIEAAIASAKSSVLDNFGDVYSTVIFATVLSDFTFNSGVSAAISSLDALDFALLGSISVVTGVIAAVAAHLTRPQLVDSVASLLTTLQLVYLRNPDMRRVEKDAKEMTEEEVDRLEEEAENNGSLEVAGDGGAAADPANHVDMAQLQISASNKGWGRC